MAGVIGIVPVIIKHKLVHVIPIRKLYACPNLKDIKIWTNKGWMPIIGIEREKTCQKIYRISNCYNWLYATGDCELLLENEDTIRFSNVVENTKLFQMNYPESRVFFLPVPKNIEPVPFKIMSIEDAIERSEEDIHNLTDYINCSNLKAAKQAFLNHRNNLQPNITIVWDFIELQQKMLLAEKTGFQPRIVQSSLPNSLRFKSSYEDVKHDYEYLNQDAIDFKTGETIHLSYNYTYEDYLKEMNEVYSEKYLSYPLFLEESGAWDLFEYKRNEFNTPLREWRKPLFEYSKQFIYQIKTGNGFYQAGVGKLVIKGKSY